MRNLVKFLFFVAVLVIVGHMLSSCRLTKQERADNRVVKKLDKLKAKNPESFKNATTETVRIDTVLQEIKVAGASVIEVQLDSAAIDSLEILIKELRLAPGSIERVTKYISENIELDAISKDTLNLHLSIWYNKKESTINYTLVKDEQHIEVSKDIKTITVTRTEVVNRVPWYIWTIIVALAITTLLAVLKSTR